ncbi:MAG TPA: hypothetical protein PLW99_01245, partial [Candidatus Paceibacterota bacterium]|nr:hypothetical protein [Candidatus Paceibacterota bacterium]
LSWCGGGSTASAGGANPTAPCFSADGTALPVLTPGSVIHDVAQKAVTSGFDQLYAQLGSANDLDSALVAIANTLINQVISTGGLFGGSAPSSSTVGGARNLTSQLQGYSDSSVAANTSGAATAQSVLDRLSGYTTAWQTIADAATAASASATQLAKVCTDAAASYAGGNGTFVSAAQAQAATAQSVITTEIAPVLAEAQTATSSTVATQAFATKVQAEAVAGSAGSSGTLSSDVATLVTMPPSVNDVAAVQQNAQVYNAAMANPTGSLTVSGGSLVDQMHLISTNAQKLETTVCNPNSSLYVQFGVNGLP